MAVSRRFSSASKSRRTPAEFLTLLDQGLNQSEVAGRVKAVRQTVAQWAKDRRELRFRRQRRSCADPGGLFFNAGPSHPSPAAISSSLRSRALPVGRWGSSPNSSTLSKHVPGDSGYRIPVPADGLPGDRSAGGAAYPRSPDPSRNRCSNVRRPLSVNFGMRPARPACRSASSPCQGLPKNFRAFIDNSIATILAQAQRPFNARKSRGRMPELFYCAAPVEEMQSGARHY